MTEKYKNKEKIFDIFIFLFIIKILVRANLLSYESVLWGKTMKIHSVWSGDGITVEPDTISRRTFYGILTAVLLWGFVLMSIISLMTLEAKFTVIEFLLIGLVIPLVGICLSAFSKKPTISFVGFNLVVGGLTAVIGPALNIHASKHPGIVLDAIILTAVITCVMGASGVIFPRFYRRIGGMLFVALLAVVIVSVLGIFFPFFDFGWVAYLAAGVFSLYIGYDMHRATVIPATVDNAIDVAVALYVDIINLFLQILKILASSDD